MRLGLDDPEGEDEVLVGSRQPTNGGFGADTPPETARAIARALATAGDPEQDTISGAVDRLVRDEWEPMMEPVIEPLLEAAGAAIRSGESLEDFQSRMPALFAEMDASRLTETLRRMGFSARLSGNAGLE